MAAYLAKLGPNTNQQDILQKLKSNGGDAVQTSDGLCIKTSMGQAELEKLLGVAVAPVGASDDLSPDVRKFLG